MVKPLRFKGDPKPKKRKRIAATTLTEDSRSSIITASAVAQQDSNVEDDNTWVSADAASDVSGPIMILLPTSEEHPVAAALACDSAGMVYAMPVENLVDGMAASSAEPHDVRMVWVANKVVGAKEEDINDNNGKDKKSTAAAHLRFKSHHGMFLGIDPKGIVSATSEVMSSLESFVLLPFSCSTTAVGETEMGRFLLRSAGGQYLRCGKAGKVVGDNNAFANEDEMTAEEELVVTIRMQARFKPQLQAAKAEKAKEKVSRRELEAAAGRRLEEDEVRMLKRARREGDYHEKLLDIKVKGKHDKYG